MPTLYNVINSPPRSPKRSGRKETVSTLVFDVAPDATKTEVSRQSKRCSK